MPRKILRTRCSGQWTEAQYISFIKNQLRGASRKWRPIQETMREARVGHGIYKCNVCHCNVPVTILLNNKRVKNVVVDHIIPVVDPEKGFTTWDDFISRLFCERDGFQVLCLECHMKKTLKERQIAKERNKNGE